MWIRQQEIHQFDPEAMALYLDLDGNITETGGSNFVIFREGCVVSPRRDNILWRVSLEVLTEILAEMNVPFVAENIQAWDVVNAEEAWAPSTPWCLGPVVRFNGEPIGEGKPGPTWRKILDRCSERGDKDISHDIMKSGS